MSIVRYSPSEGASSSGGDEFARLDAMTDEEISRAAEEDADNPPLTDHELQLVRTSRVSQLARQAAGLSQEAFAKAYSLSLGRVRDLEQGRTTADTPLLYFLRQIAKDPQGVRAELESRAA